MNYGTKNIISKELVFHQLFWLSSGRQIGRGERNRMCRSSRGSETAKRGSKRKKKVKCPFRGTKKLSAFQRSCKLYFALYRCGASLAVSHQGDNCRARETRQAFKCFPILSFFLCASFRKEKFALYISEAYLVHVEKLVGFSYCFLSLRLFHVNGDKVFT